MTETCSQHMARAQQTIDRLTSEPDHNWHIRRNTDGGAAAIDFIRYAKIRNHVSALGRAHAELTFGADVVKAALS